MDNNIELNENNFLDKVKTKSKSAGETLKYGAHKAIGSITKGGKYLGKSKLSKQAEKQIYKVFDNHKMIKELDKLIDNRAPEFPNDKKNETFLKGLELIGLYYDNLVIAAKESEKPTEVILEVINKEIKALRVYTKKLIDYDLGSVYRVFNEQEDVISGDDTETGTEKRLKSNRAVLTLAGIGSLLGGFKWVLNTEWFTELFGDKVEGFNISKVKEIASDDATYVVGSGQGITQVLNSMYPEANLGPSSTLEDMKTYLSKMGGGDLSEGIKAASSMNPNQSDNIVKGLTELSKMDGSTPLKDALVNEYSGTGKKIGDLLTTKPGMVVSFKKMIIKTVVKKVATVAVKQGAMAAGLSSVLGPVAVGSLALAAAIKIARMKGLRSSRFKDLNTVLQKMVLLTPQDIQKKLGPSYSKIEKLPSLNKALDRDAEQMSLDAGQKSLDTGQKSLDVGQKSLDTGQKSLDVGQKSLPASEKDSELPQPEIDIDSIKDSGEIPFNLFGNKPMPVNKNKIPDQVFNRLVKIFANLEKIKRSSSKNINENYAISKLLNKDSNNILGVTKDFASGKREKGTRFKPTDKDIRHAIIKAVEFKKSLISLIKLTANLMNTEGIEELLGSEFNRLNSSLNRMEVFNNPSKLNSLTTVSFTTNDDSKMSRNDKDEATKETVFQVYRLYRLLNKTFFELTEPEDLGNAVKYFTKNRNDVGQVYNILITLSYIINKISKYENK